MTIDNDNSVKANNFNITEKGSLGLLALGDIGIREWRKVKKNIEKAKGNTDEKR
ncbi:hypothetical protein [Winogradskyella thalassocola]|uniref:Uncharacterized protein n=1 Tax=Winogradskyella thalassocola TaxID=262004 RepID=A0A1G8K3E8_9FLAO|nr:hypothetical protein [Winogradskyella thalassocola]SDI37972.1 hypothetical protein SAMN04489796_11058 [Winogradskyella thalassocola]